MTLLVFSLLFIGLASTIIAWPSYMYALDPDQEHSSCHSGGLANTSVNGSILISLSSGNIMSPNQVFTLTVTILGFTEAGTDCTLGFSFQVGDNDQFGYKIQNVDGSYFSSSKEGVSLDGSGNSAQNSFSLVTPSKNGIYNLTVMAVHSEGFPTVGPWTIISESRIITITQESSIPGYDILLISIVGIIATVSLLSIRNKKKKRKEELVEE
jgi:hypothetical protein